jgi:hypothetical protein
MKFIFVAIALASTALANHPRRFLKPKDNVSQMIKQNQSNERDGTSKERGRYTIHTVIKGGSTELAMDVVEPASPAVDQATIIKDAQGNHLNIGKEILLYNLLVTDVTTTDGADSFAMLAINPETDEMHGIVEKKGKRGERVPYKINQNNNENQGLATAQEEVVDFEAAADFHCDVVEQVINEAKETGRKLRKGAYDVSY